MESNIFTYVNYGVYYHLHRGLDLRGLLNKVYKLNKVSEISSSSFVTCLQYKKEISNSDIQLKFKAKTKLFVNTQTSRQETFINASWAILLLSTFSMLCAANLTHWAFNKT